MNVRRFTLPIMPLQHTFVIEEKKKTIKKLNQYLLLKKIGSGSSSKVYVAQDTITDEYYAAKVIKISEKTDGGNGLLVLQREIRLLKKFSHPNVIKLHEVLNAPKNGYVCMLLEYADCGSLENMINAKTYFSEEFIASIFKQIAEGLIYLHEKENIVHRDVKPSNILLFSKGTAKLTDFGIGHTFQSAETVIGTPAYQAPELFEDEEEYEDDINPTKEDVWSLGITLYETAFGVLPYSGSNLFEIVNDIKSRPLKFPEEHNRSEELLDLIVNMLRVDPNKRVSLEEVKKHPFIQKALDVIPLKKPNPIKTDDIDPSAITEIEAEVWDENRSFAPILF